MKNYTGGFGKGMGKYGDKEYPDFYPNEKVIITLPYYSRKVAKNIIIGEGIIKDHMKDFLLVLFQDFL